MTELTNDKSWRPLDDVLAVVGDLCPSCWGNDSPVKYLEVRIDTRDVHVLLYAASFPDEDARELVSLDRVRAAIATCKKAGRHKLEPNGLTWRAPT